MARTIAAIYENGVFRPTQPVGDLPEHASVQLTVEPAAVATVETAGLEPLRMTQLDDHGSRFKLREPLVVNVEYADGLWVYSHPALNLWGSAPRREDALGDLAANFHYLWDEFAQEDDDALDAKAQAIKQRLLAIVETAPGGGN